MDPIEQEAAIVGFARQPFGLAQETPQEDVTAPKGGLELPAPHTLCWQKRPGLIDLGRGWGLCQPVRIPWAQTQHRSPPKPGPNAKKRLKQLHPFNVNLIDDGQSN